MKAHRSLSSRALHPLGGTLCVLLALTLGQADTLELKDGKVLSGKYAGGTPGTIRFETSTGIQILETSQVRTLTLTGQSAPAAAPPAASPGSATPAPAAGSAPSKMTINAGTALLVRMVDPVSSNDPDGKRFTTTLETDLVVNGTVIARAGSKVYGKVLSAQKARRFVGQSSLDLRLCELAVGPNLIPLVTGGYQQSGEKTIKKTARGAAAGAAIGAIADGGSGAATGAAIGAVASGVKKGQGIAIQPGALLEFRLEQPLTVAVTQ